MSKYIMKLSPQRHTTFNVSYIIFILAFALLPAILLSIYKFGYRILLIYIITMVLSGIFEWTFKYLKGDKPTFKDFMEMKGAITGALIVLTLPPYVPLYVLPIAAFIAIVIAKQMFGGFGRNLFNPALTARVMLLVAFPSVMSRFLLPTTNIFQNGLFNISLQPLDTISSATTLTTAKEIIRRGGELPFLSTDLWLPSFLGNTAGSIGEVSALAILVGMLILLISRVITWHVSFSYLGSFIIFTTLIWTFNIGQVLDPVTQLLSGGLLFGAIFMATDFVTSPLHARGKIIFGIGCGLLTVLIRTYSSYPEGVGFSILLMNALVPIIDRYTRPRSFGE